MISRGLVLSFEVLITVGMLFPQQLHREHTEFASQATIQAVDSTATITANSPRPLLQALDGIAQQYAWTVNYEDPPYRNQELADDTNPQWRALHPQAAGARIPAGGMFTAQVPLSPHMERGSKGELLALQKLLADYSQSGNPGSFDLLASDTGYFSVIGKNGSVSGNRHSLLDTPVSLPSTLRTADATVQLILKAVSTQTGITILIATMPRNVTARNRVSVGGVGVPARELLEQTITKMPRKFVWQLLLDSDQGTYYFNLIPVVQKHRDSSGREVIEFLP